MNIAVIGTGYVGLVTGTVLAEIGHEVTCIDIDANKVALLLKGKSPIYEPGLDDLLHQNIERDRLSFTTDCQEGIKNADIIFLAVGTPQGENGAANLSYIEQAAKDVAEHLDHNAIVVIKSTVPVGTNDKIELLIKKELKHPVMIDVVSNPEFLREGHAIHDTFHGDRIVIGAENEEVANTVEQLFKPLQLPIVKTDRRSAEMIKYAANAFLAVKISYINEIANLCDKLNADVNAVADGIGMDRRIGRAFLNAGIGYGGSCFPKDTEALVHLAGDYHSKLKTVQAAIQVNKDQRNVFIDKVVHHFHGDLNNKKMAILGLAFKPDTDDMREAPSLTIIEELRSLGANVAVFDPIVKSDPMLDFLPIQYSQSIEECVGGADAVLLVTEWGDFLQADWEHLGTLVKEKTLFDGRNALLAPQLQQAGWAYIGIGTKGILNTPVLQ